MNNQNQQWWAKEVNEILKDLQTDPDGLSGEEAKQRLAQGGENDIRIGGTNFLAILLRQFASPLIVLLFIAALSSLFISQLFDFYLILAVIIFQIILTFIQEYNAQKILESLNKFLQVNAYVLRDGEWRQTQAKDLVVGDIVKVSFGDIIPADLRFYRTFRVKINEAILTGESQLVEKSIEKLIVTTVLSERKNMAFRGTTVVEGEGFGVVVATGLTTELGKLSEEIQKIETPSPLQRDVKKLSRLITAVIIFAILLLTLLFLWQSRSLADILPTMIALTAGSIPEGLPLALALILLLSAQKLLKSNVLIRNLSSVDALARLDLFLLDKTGTITKAQVSLSDVLIESELIDYHKREKEKPELLPKDLPRHFFALEVASLCFPPHSLLGKNLSLGLEKFGFEPNSLRNKYPLLDSIPFNPFDKFSVHLFHNPENKNSGTKNLLTIIGAPERVLEKTNSIWINGKVEKIDQVSRKKVLDSIRYFTENAFYTLALGYQEIEASKIADFDNIPLFSFLAFTDPVRDDANETLRELRKEGLGIYLLTGDHKLVAQKIGFDINLIQSPEEIYDLSENVSLPAKIEDFKIYSRITPQHKREIVSYFQTKNKIVGMIGDGVNDIPSLKQADVGIALGAGAEATKEAADMVILDNRLSSLLLAFRQGQAVIGTIQKIIGFLLLMSFDMLITFFVVFLLQMPYPVTTSQILFLNFFEDSFLAANFILNPVPLKGRTVFEKKFIIFLIAATIVFLGMILLFSFASLDHLKVYGMEYWRTAVFSFFYFNAVITSIVFLTFPHSFLVIFKKENLKAFLPLLLMVVVFVLIFQNEFSVHLLNLRLLALREVLFIPIFILMNLIFLEILKTAFRKKFQ